ncbi:MAG: hypothetical protein NUV86_02795 [Candidatus Scalindua sp.]|nr:hypothetical protein [Candidatus Scalindua sp.]MCR4344019.1 hypothetical protein [Candidatus Scalindua sp.]
MIVIETLAFTRRVMALLQDDEYTAMQWFLRFKPDAGDIIQRTGGARKVRWRKKGQGKRGGLRVIYFHHVEKDTICGCWLFMRKKQKKIYQNPTRRLSNN